MHLNPLRVITFTWEALGVLWLVGLAFTKRTARTRDPGARLFYTFVALLALLFLAGNKLDAGWFGARMIPLSPASTWVGASLALFGCTFAAWARLTLGANWSGRPSVKVGHELIIRGPYALVRHPIYTGILLAAAGTSIAIDKWSCLIGLLLLVIAFLMKMSQEERLMLETFPQAYPVYRNRVRALIPGVF
jgi:protein-S-isoprenylcysteine O-methyltransferase Ste14